MKIRFRNVIDWIAGGGGEAGGGEGSERVSGGEQWIR